MIKIPLLRLVPKLMVFTGNPQKLHLNPIGNLWKELYLMNFWITSGSSTFFIRGYVNFIDLVNSFLDLAHHIGPIILILRMTFG